MASKSSRQLSGSGRMGSQVYPHEPTPMHFTQLFLPKASVMPPPATYAKPRRDRSCGLGCFCCSIIATLCSLLFTLAFLLGIAALITWLVLRPVHMPKYSLDGVELRTFSVTPQNTLNADVVYNITANNPNGKIGFKYDSINIDTSYGGHVFGHSSIPAFSQGHRSITTLTSQAVVNNYAFVPENLGSTLATDVQRGSVALHVRGSAKVRAKIGAITTFLVRVHLTCDITVKPPTATSPGSVISKTCKLTR